VATQWKIPKSDADFGQTFGQWGWKPHFYIMLPVYGPSNDRDTVGLAADTAANPLIYISPYAFVADDPLTWLGPYTYLSYVIMYNNLSDSVGGYVRFSQAEMDPYSEIQYAWTFVRANRVANFQVKGKQDPVGLDSGDGQKIKVHVLVAAGAGERGLYCSRFGRPSAVGGLSGAGRAGL
jgi:ABC-type transporter lipoprotein component MlaA